MGEAKTQPGWQRALMPLLVALAGLGLGTLLVYPMVNMDPQDVPIAVLNLDEGVTTPLGGMNIGGQVSDTVLGKERDPGDVESLLTVIEGSKDEVLMDGQEAADEVEDGDTDDMVAWVLMSTRAEVDQALADNEIYAALIVPADFTSSQVKAMLGAGEAAPLTLIVNEGKNPMVTGQLSSSIETFGGTDAVRVETEYYHDVPDSLGLIASFLPMMLMILVYLSSYASAITLHSAIPLQKAGRIRTAGLQILLAACLAALIGAGTALLLSALTDLEFSVLDTAIFQGLAALALVTLVVGSVNWVGMAGMAVPVLILLTGMVTADFPYEFLPAFWQDFIYPWNPLRFIADGGRALLYQGATWWNPATLGLLVAAGVGILLTATAAVNPLQRTKREFQ